jgi:serine/threonine protein kinase
MRNFCARTSRMPAQSRAAQPRNASCFEWRIVDLLAPGTIIADRYQLIRKRGSGGVGSVWLAHDRSLDSFCGIKLIDVRQENAVELGVRAEREARSAAQIRCTNVVDVFEHGTWRGIPFITMEFLEGEDLGERLKRTTRLSPEQTYRIVAQVARALVRAHGIGIVHRDVKPDNIFLAPGDEHEVAKVLDFGVARHASYSPESKTTLAGSLIGTPCYLSPEQARGETIDWRSDLWALGVLVFECLTGRLPFASEALGELMLMILCGPIPPMRRFNPELPEAVDGWWWRASARDPAQRFQSAKQLADALAIALGVDPRLEIPDILPLGLRSLGVSSLPPVSLPAAVAQDRVPAAAESGGGWQSANSLKSQGTAFPLRRRRPLHQRWLLPAGLAAVLAVVAISTISRARDMQGVKSPPALLRRSPAIALPLPPPPSEPERVLVPAKRRKVLSMRKPVPASRAPSPKSGPAPDAGPLRKLAQPIGEPARACERDPAPAEASDVEGVPDYGI